MIESLVGRLPLTTESNKDSKGWVIVDRSGAMASTVLTDHDGDFDQNDE